LDVFLPDLITKHDCIKLGVAAVVVEWAEEGSVLHAEWEECCKDMRTDKNMGGGVTIVCVALQSMCIAWTVCWKDCTLDEKDKMGVIWITDMSRICTLILRW
jgi:hypothetical protein